MKKAIALIMCLTVFATSGLYAKIWRVNNAGISVDFTSIQAAHDAAAVLAGDTLHLEPSLFTYGSLISTKPLIIFGPGYFLNLNPNQQANIVSATIASFTLNGGSEGTVISGLTITGNSTISTGNVSILRNNIGGIIYFSTTSTYSNVVIAGNYCGNFITAAPGTGVITNVLILNNYLSKVDLNSQYSGIIANNVIFEYYGQTANFTIKNNICTASTNAECFLGNFNTIVNNICASAAGLPAGNGNQTSVPMSTVFVGATGNSTDGQWQLTAGSPAIGAGLSGEDCGMYGGNTPYHLSGLPKIPAVYFLSAPTNSNGNILPVTISVKTNN